MLKEVQVDGKARLDKIKDPLIRFVETLSVHGVPRLYKSNILLVRLVWTICILISCSFGLFCIYNSVKDYSQFDVITNVERVNPKNVTFPAITICTKGFYVEKNLSKIDYSTLYYTYFDDYLEDFTKSTTYKDTKVDMLNDLEYFNISKSFGRCVRFNGFTRKSFEIAESKTDYFRTNILSNIQAFTADEYTLTENIHKEAEVYILDNYLNSYLNSDPLRVPLDKNHLISFAKAEVEKKLPGPYNFCIDHKNITYRQENCIEQCLNVKIADKYNCSIPSYYSIKDLEECGGVLLPSKFDGSFKSPTSVSYEKHVDVIKSIISEFDSICHKQCDKECESSLFNKQVITTNGNFFEFSFSDFSSLSITQIPKTDTFSLISSLGGLMGLFVGLSFFKFCGNT